jgi:hypothetical protein
MLQIVFLMSLESSQWGGVHGLGSMMFGLAVQKFLNKEWFFHWKWNYSWKFRRDWNVSVVLLERSWWAGFNGIYLVRFGFRMWQILNFKWFPTLKIQMNSKKPGFGRKISWGCGNTWANDTGHTSIPEKPTMASLLNFKLKHQVENNKKIWNSFWAMWSVIISSK